MAVRLVINISDSDLGFFRKTMDEVWSRNSARDEREIIDGARRLLHATETASTPEYVRNRLHDFGSMITMLTDSEWPLDEADRSRIVAALSYFAEPADAIPDAMPGLGFLDDALMAELVLRELKHELDGYRDFCRYRENEATLRGNTDVSREDWLAAKRRQIYLRIKRRQQESRRHGSREGPTDPILRYQY